MLRLFILFLIFCGEHSSSMAFNQNHTATSNTTFRIGPPTSFTSMSVFNGSSVTLPCNEPGNYTVSHLWWFNENIIFSKNFKPIEIGISNVEGRIINGTTSYLKISQFTASNVGNYSCSIGDISEICYRLSLNSTSNTQIELFVFCLYDTCTEALVLLESSAYQFQCFSNVIPVDLLKWSVNGVAVTDNISHQRRQFLLNHTDAIISVLTIHPKVDHVNISCSAENNSKSVTFEVLSTYDDKTNQPVGTTFALIISATLGFVFVLVLLSLSIAFKIGKRRGSSHMQHSTQTKSSNIPIGYSTPVENIDLTEELPDYAYVDEGNKSLKHRFMEENIVYEADIPGSSKHLRWIGTLAVSNGKLEKVVVSNIKDYSSSVLRSLWKAYIERTSVLPDHNNLVTTFGYYINNGYTYSIQEYTASTLKSHLSSEYGNLSNTKSSIVQGAFLRFSNDIINGMEYLSSKGCSHPGLQCKKVLLNVFQVCKLYDFCSSGTAVNVIEFYVEKEQMEAVTTFAPESIFLGEHSPASDIWALGLTLWEIYSGGDDPFRLVKKEDFEKLLKTRIVLRQPEDCPETIFTVMRQCWSKKSQDRPQLSKIKSTFEGTYTSRDKATCEVASQKVSEHHAVYNTNIY